MKKFKSVSILLAGMMIGSMTVSAVAAATTSNSVNTKSVKTQTVTIGAQKAKEIALAHAGLKAEEVTFEKAKLEYDNKVPVYDVEFYTATTEYEYEIDAVSGAIRESQKENRRNQSSVGTNTQNPTNEVTNTPANGQPSTNEGTNTPSNEQPSTNEGVSTPSNDQTSTTQNEKITVEKAKEIALTHAGLTAGDVTFKKAKLEYDNRVAVYDVEFYTASAEYEYEINAASGAIIESDKEVKKVQSSVNQNTNTQKPSNGQTSTTQKETITSAKAKEVALAHAGLAASDVVFEKAKLDKEDGISVYEVEFKHNGMEYSYEINAVSGAVVEFEVDRD